MERVRPVLTHLIATSPDYSAKVRQSPLDSLSPPGANMCQPRARRSTIASERLG
jgi:hypothetical protein